jgi:uncharacterized protein DUF2868
MLVGRATAPLPMTLANLIDLEAQLSRDRDADPAALAARDRALLAGFPAGAPGPRGALLARWLDALRAREPAALHPGRAVTGALATVRAALALGGLLLGWGAGTALTHYAGGHPVNVWDLVLAFVGVQVVLLVLLLASFVLPLAAFGAPVTGLVRGAVGALYPRVAARLAPGGASRAEEWRALWHRVRSRRSLYHAVEPWLLLSLTQAFGVAFNLGVLAAVLRLVVFTDVAFGWSTTLVELDAPRFHALSRAIAWPWRALWPEAVPSEALVEATRYSRLEAAYAAAGAGRSAHPELVGGWWRFLVAALLAYGLLPRALLLAVSRLRAARLLATLPHDDAEVTRLVGRLSGPHVDMRAPVAEAPGAAPGGGLAAAPAAAPGAPCALVLWRDVPGGAPLEAAVSRALERPVLRARSAGGRDHEEPDPAALAALGAGVDPVVVVAEAFEPPDRAARRFLAALRAALGPRRLVLVLLVGAAADGPRPPRDADVRVWRDGLSPLEDPFLAVEPLGEAT